MQDKQATNYGTVMNADEVNTVRGGLVPVPRFEPEPYPPHPGVPSNPFDHILTYPRRPYPFVGTL